MATPSDYKMLSIRDTMGQADLDNSMLANQESLRQNAALNRDAARFDLDTARKNQGKLEDIDTLYALSGGIKLMRENPDQVPAVLNEFHKSGITQDRFEVSPMDPNFQAELAEAEEMVNMQIQSMDRPDRKTFADMTSAEKNYAQYSAMPETTPEEIAAKGKFYDMVRAPQYADIGGVRTRLGDTPGANVPLSTPEVELDFVRREAEAKEAGGRAGAPTKGTETIDTEFAKEYVTWTTGGFQDAEKGISQLAEVRDALATGQNLTGWEIAIQPDWAKAVISPEALQAKEQVEEVVQRNLRLILGAQFTEKEGTRLIKRAYNPALEESYNIVRINRLMTQMESSLQAKIAAVRYYEANGTLAGFEIPMTSLEAWEREQRELLNEALDADLVPGDVIDGREYLGGHPGEQSSWSQAQQ